VRLGEAVAGEIPLLLVTILFVRRIARRKHLITRKSWPPLMRSSSAYRTRPSSRQTPSAAHCTE
jgi:hypothetical protein